ncbi:MAG: hydroxyacid dehydrogenase [Methylothermaceae bacteria B42]|nr:MAG: hydroxyacid dehydrogenase [Methylothermaceae bacteria B42]HHJ38924.1 2-hydroxyacid dehydrogenase [Methylothermaceae bacterium]
MKVLVYSTHSYDQEYLEAANQGKHELKYTPAALDIDTAALAWGIPAVCCFVEDKLDAEVLKRLAGGGTRLVALRCTGFNNVDLEAAQSLGLTVMRVSRYSPYAVAEFAVGLILALNRKIHRAYNRIREGNFLLDGLLGFDLHGKTIGIVGTGKIGTVLAGIMQGFGCTLLGYDKYPNQTCIDLGMHYVELNDLLAQSDIVSLHAPLTPQTHHLIHDKTITHMKSGAMLINTSRGGLVDTEALIEALKAGQIGAVGLDVYEEEGHMYYRDLSDQVIADDVFARLLTFPNVIVTGHQAFFTREALTTIARTTIENISDFAAGRSNDNELKPEHVISTATKNGNKKTLST